MSEGGTAPERSFIWRPATLVTLGVLCSALALGAEWATIHARIPENHYLDLLSGLVFIVTGLVAMDRRPGNRLGPLMVAIGVTWFCGNYVNLAIPGLISVLLVANGICDALRCTRLWRIRAAA